VILERMLEPEPERRYASATEVLRALDGDTRPAAAPALADPAGGPASTALARGHRELETALARLTPAPRALTPALERLLDAREPRGSSGVGLTLLLFFACMLVAIVAGLAKLQPLMVLGTVAAITSLFVVPMLGKGTARRIYVSGRVAPGEIRSATPSDGALHVAYAFRHEDQEVGGSLDVTDAFLARRVEPSTPVLVFFEPQRPEESVGLLVDELPAAGHDEP
jgi:hypothetical protein